MAVDTGHTMVVGIGAMATVAVTVPAVTAATMADPVAVITMAGDTTETGMTKQKAL